MFKWTGGKRREIERILEYLPPFTTPGEDWHYVEPFAGGAALYFALEHTPAFPPYLVSEMRQ